MCTRSWSSCNKRKLPAWKCLLLRSFFGFIFLYFIFHFCKWCTSNKFDFTYGATRTEVTGNGIEYSFSQTNRNNPRTNYRRNFGRQVSFIIIRERHDSWPMNLKEGPFRDQGILLKIFKNVADTKNIIIVKLNQNFILGQSWKLGKLLI